MKMIYKSPQFSYLGNFKIIKGSEPPAGFTLHQSTGPDFTGT